jgi:hypothetical protein
MPKDITLAKRNLYFKIIGEMFEKIPEHVKIEFALQKDDFHDFLKAISDQVTFIDLEVNFIRYRSIKTADKQMILEQFKSLKILLQNKDVNVNEFFKPIIEEYRDFFTYLNS